MSQSLRFVRFAMIGALVATIYVLLYVLFLHFGVAQAVANMSAFLLAVAVQYVGQAGFTFRVRIVDAAQGFRFLVMICCGLVTSALITGVLAPAAAIPDWLAAVAVAVVLPFQNYLIMSRWVFFR